MHHHTEIILAMAAEMVPEMDRMGKSARISKGGSCDGSCKDQRKTFALTMGRM